MNRFWEGRHLNSRYNEDSTYDQYSDAVTSAAEATSAGSTPSTHFPSITYHDPRLHGLPLPARDQRRLGAGRPWLPHASASRHGDHHLRAGWRSRAQGQHGQRLHHSARRRAAHECRNRRAPQRSQRLENRPGAPAADLDSARPQRPRARLRAEGVSGGGKARQVAPDRQPGWQGRLRDHPPGCQAVCVASRSRRRK